MAYEVVLPRLGWDMEVGSLEKWLKNDGDSVETGDIILTAEGDKAVQEVEALESGILRIPADSPKPGEEIKVGTVLGYILKPGESIPESAGSAPASASAAEAAPAKPSVSTATPAGPSASPSSPAAAQAAVSGGGNGTKRAICPRARMIAKELGVDWTGLQGSGSSGRIVERDIRQAAGGTGQEARINISPVARKVAEAAGIDLAQLAAQNPGKRIMREDVDAAIAARGKAGAGAAPAPVAGQPMPVTQTRRIIARRMVESGSTAAPLTLNTEADATGLVMLREQLKATLAPRDKAVPTYNDLLIKLTSVALQEHPLLNARWSENEIVTFEETHIGVAVDSESGLIVPVIRNGA